jgi:hypothetical protein
MKNLTIMGALALLTAPAKAADYMDCDVASVTDVVKGLVLANPCNEVPEMSAGAGVAAIALLVGVAAIIRERTKRK